MNSFPHFNQDFSTSQTYSQHSANMDPVFMFTPTNDGNLGAAEWVQVSAPSTVLQTGENLGAFGNFRTTSAGATSWYPQNDLEASQSLDQSSSIWPEILPVRKAQNAHWEPRGNSWMSHGAAFEGFHSISAGTTAGYLENGSWPSQSFGHSSSMWHEMPPVQVTQNADPEPQGNSGMSHHKASEGFHSLSAGTTAGYPENGSWPSQSLGHSSSMWHEMPSVQVTQNADSEPQGAPELYHDLAFEGSQPISAGTVAGYSAIDPVPSQSLGQSSTLRPGMPPVGVTQNADPTPRGTSGANKRKAISRAAASGDRCAVCNAPANGKHYGAVCCDACKGFFKRSVTIDQREDSVRFECRHQNLCVVNAGNRNNCRACRLKKCFRMGMRLPNQNKTAACPPRATVDANFEQLVNETLAVLQDTDSEQPAREPERPRTPVVITGRITETFGKFSESLTAWARTIPSLLRLSEESRAILVEEAATEIFLLDMLQRSQEHKFFDLGSGLMSVGHATDDALEPENVRATSLISMFLEVRRHNVIRREFAYLRAMSLFNHRVTSLEDQVRVGIKAKNFSEDLAIEQTGGGKDRYATLLSIWRNTSLLARKLQVHLRDTGALDSSRISAMLKAYFWRK